MWLPNADSFVVTGHPSQAPHHQIPVTRLTLPVQTGDLTAFWTASRLMSRINDSSHWGNGVQLTAKDSR